MNIEVFFKKQGILAIPITVSMHNGVEIFFKEKDIELNFLSLFLKIVLFFFNFSINYNYEF